MPSIAFLSISLIIFSFIIIFQLFLQDKIKKEVGIKNILPDSKVAKLSIVGIGMRTNAGIAEEMFKALAKEKINIDLISTSEIKISVLISRKHLLKAVNVLHKVFKLSDKIKK